MKGLLVYMLIAVSTTGQAAADTVLAARTIRSQAILTPQDVLLKDGTVPGALTRLDDAIGLEARVVLYAGRPIRPGDVGPAAIVERNQIVTLIYQSGGLRIEAEGRALGRAGVGDRIRVMNLMSRTTITGTVTPDGTVSASPD